MAPYALPGTPDFPQVEPQASAWPRCPLLSTIGFDQIQKRVDGVVKPYNPLDEAKELAELRTLFDERMDQPPGLSIFLRNSLFFERVPAGAVLSTYRTGAALPVTSGVELATLFEAETPGLWHQHVLNVILDPTVRRGAGQMLSPPRQAVIWSALYVAISSALNAAWHYKWVAEGLAKPDQVAYRQRPAEADANLNVLYDLMIEFSGGETGHIIRQRPKTLPQRAPGSPRHPAYPSGHSTYSAAASRVLGRLFRDYKDPRPALAQVEWEVEFKKLADNIGVARLYGGVHWRGDHVAGQAVGNAIGDLILEQLKGSAVPDKPIKEVDPLTRKARETRAQNQKCGERSKEADNALDFTDAGIQQKVQFVNDAEDEDPPAST